MISNGFLNEYADIIKSGGVGAIPTDTIYGLSVSALHKSAIEKLYEIRKPGLGHKPFIILISSIDDLALFDIYLNKGQTAFLNKIWPNKVTAILPCSSEKFNYLHRGTDTLGFRLPNKQDLIEFIKKSGPIVSTSINMPFNPPAKNINEAKEYFEDHIDFYVDEGDICGEPSTIIKLENKKFNIIRAGAEKIQASG